MSKLKIIGVAAASIIAVQVIGAKVIGSNIASGIKTVTNSYANMSAVPLRVISSNASWFKTDITLGVKLPPNILQNFGDHITPLLTPIDGENYLTLSETFHHGPFILKDGVQVAAAYTNGAFEMSDNVEQFIKNVIDENKTLSDAERSQLHIIAGKIQKLIKSDYQLSVGFDGQLTYSSQMTQAEDRFEFVNKHGKGLDVTVKLPTSAATIVYDTTAQELKINSTSNSPLSISSATQGQKFNFEMGAMDLTQTASLLADNIWIGNTDLSIANIIFSLDEKKGPIDFKFGPSKIAYNITPTDQDSLNYEIIYDFKDMIATTPQGPISLDHIQTDISANNIDIQLISTYNQMNTMMMQAMFKGAHKDIQEAEQFAQTALPQAFIQAIEKKPVIKLNNFSIAKDGHQSDMSMTVALKDDYTINAPKIQDYIIGDGSLNLNVDMINALAPEIAATNPNLTAEQLKQTIQQQLNALSSQGLLTKSGVKYTSDLSLKDGFILMNGTPVAPLK